MKIDNQILFDFTCTLSMQTWDNIRRICMLFSRDKIQKNEKTYLFIAFYGIFIIVIFYSFMEKN